MTGLILWSIVLALHIVCIAYWVGGGLTIISAQKNLMLLETTHRQNVLLQTYSRYVRALWHVVPIALLSGWALIFHIGGFAVVPWPVNAMQIIGLAMAATFVSLALGPLRAARRAIRPPAALFETIRRRIVAMLALGVLSILCAAMSAA